jgi:hypothetical protein
METQEEYFKYEPMPKQEEEVKAEPMKDPWLLITDFDEDGLPSSWKEIETEIHEKGIYALESAFEWQLENTSYFDTMTNFYLACSYFKDIPKESDSEREIKRIESKAKRIVKEEMKKKNASIQKERMT